MAAVPALMKQDIYDHAFIARPNVSAQADSHALAVLETVGAGLFVCEGKGRSIVFVQVSSLFSQITGYSEMELLGRGFEILYGSATDPATVRSLKRALTRDQSFNGLILCYRNDGRATWFRLVLASLKLSEAPRRAAGAILDVTTHKLQEDALKARESTYRGIFENAVEGIYQSTPDGNYLEVNPALARMYGYATPRELLSQVQDIQQQIYVDPRMRERFKSEIDRNDVVHGLEYQVRRRDGKIIWICESARVVRDQNGDSRYYEGFVEEITPRKEAEAALRASQQQLIETSRQVGMAEVATGVLHNMGNALNSIQVSTAVLWDKIRSSKVAGVSKAAELISLNSAQLGSFFTDNPKGQQLPRYLANLGQHLAKEQLELREELARLRASLEHINAIVAMQQSYAKASQLAEKVSPIELMEDALRMSSSAIAHGEIQVVREYAPDLPEVTVSKHAVLQILINLIRNAQRACTASTSDLRRLTLRLQSSRGGQFLRMEVTDNGIGISPAILARLFHHGFTTRPDGHGFGLHSGALIAKELGGALTAASAGAGQGATFTLEFPRIPVAK